MSIKLETFLRHTPALVVAAVTIALGMIIGTAIMLVVAVYAALYSQPLSILGGVLIALSPGLVLTGLAMIMQQRLLENNGDDGGDQ